MNSKTKTARAASPVPHRPKREREHKRYRIYLHFTVSAPSLAAAERAAQAAAFTLIDELNDTEHYAGAKLKSHVDYEASLI